MDGSCVEDQTLPVNFNESANPGHLLRLEDTELDVSEKNESHTSPLRTRTMKEYDQLIADLKKENFSLKLRIYFLEERIQQKLGRMDSSEDIHKANIELKVEVEALKQELTDKHGLLLTASNALDTLEAQHKAEIGRTKSDHENEKRNLSQRVQQLEKLLENHNKPSGKVESDSDVQWARAFSFMDNVSDVERSDDAPASSESKSAIFSEASKAHLPSLQKHCKELELVVDDLYKEIDKHKARNKRMESNLSSQVEELTKQKKNFAKLKMTVKRYIEATQEKEDEIKELKTELQRLSDELKQVNTFSECKNGRLRELDKHVGEPQSKFNRSIGENCDKSELQRALNGAEMESKNHASLGNCQPQTLFFEEITKEKDKMIMELLAERKESLIETEQAVKSLQNSLREKEVALARVQLAYDEKEFEFKTCQVNNREASLTSNVLDKEMTKLKNKVAMHKGCINKIKECLDTMLRGDMDGDSPHGGFVYGLSRLVSMVTSLGSLDVFSLWESRLNQFLLSLSSKAEEFASVNDDNSKFLKRIQESTAEINRLRFLLSSTEATVRMLGTKLNYQRHAVSCNGSSMIAIKANGCGRSSSSSVISSGNVDNCLSVMHDGAKPKYFSSSAPVTPLKGGDRPRFLNSDEDAVNVEEEICRLRLTIECKDQQLGCLRAEFERTRPRCSCNDVSAQTDPVIDVQPENKVRRKALAAASQNACRLLRRRLEELADFLEQLLQFDENGLLDVSVLTPQKMASIRGHLERSRELSSTLSQSLAVYGRTMSFNEEDRENYSVFGQCRHSSTSGLDNSEATCGERHDEDVTITASHQKGVSKLCNRSLFWEPIVSGSRRRLTDGNCEDVDDNLLLLLSPTSEAQTSNLDDLLVCSLSSTFHESFLTSTNVNGSRGKARDIASESDSWSEPDRGVSKQRIGLDGTFLAGGKTPINSPGRLGTTAASTTSSESELVSELGERLSRKAANRWRCVLRELKAVRAQVVELEELNLSLRTELSLYQKVCIDDGNSATVPCSTSRSPLKVRGSVSRQGRNRANADATSLSVATALIKNKTHQQQDQQLRLENHLLEISALRKKLEESIRAYDQLREQLEKKLMALQSAENLDAEVGSRLKAQIESYMKQIDERDSALCSLHKEKGNLLLEIQQLSDDFKAEQKITENLKAQLADKVTEIEGLMVTASEQDRFLNEMRCDRDKLQQSLSRAQKLLRNNDASVKSLREANNALQRDLDVAHDALHQEKGKMDELVSELGAKCKLTQDLEGEVESLRMTIEESVCSTRRNYDEQLRVKKIESDAKSGEISSLRQHKSSLEAEVVQMRAQLQAALALSQSLKAELSVFERITSTSQNAALESNVTLLVTEIRSLRLQLERSVETNTALRSQLDDSGGRVDAKGALRLDVGVFGGDHYASSSVSSPDTASSFSYAATIENTKSAPENSSESRVKRQLSKSSDYVSDDVNRLHPADVYSSPDLGIESDPNRCSSLERAASNHPAPPSLLLKGIHYLEPGMPSASSDWTSVASAPVTAMERRCVSNSFCRKRNCTFPLLRTLTDNGEDSNDQSEGFGGDTGNEDVYVIGYLEHFKLLQQSVVESLQVLAELKSKVKEPAKNNSTEVAEGDTRKVLELSCSALRNCLQDIQTVLEQFWTIPLPLVSCDGDSMENRRFEAELLRLHRDLARERKRAEDALIKLEAANRIKEGMEKAIVRQLNKTHCVLKKARGNLENQHPKIVAPQSPPKGK